MTVQQAKDLSHFLSEEAKRRKPSPLKEAFADRLIPGLISLGGGLPMPSLFPFENLSVQTRVPPFTGGPDEEITEEKHVHVNIKKEYSEADEKHLDIDLATSLQYGYTEGNPLIRDFLKEHTAKIHLPLYEDWDLILSIGNTQGWDATLRTFTNPGDVILAEEFTFSSALETVSSHGVDVVSVEMDLEGIVPEKLAELLDNWTGGPKPKLLYTIPTGQNPTGSTLSNERRAAIYKIAQKHDFLIIEDEPYYFLQMPEYTTDLKKREESEHISHEDFYKSLVSSFLKFDTDGRVFRLDSVSKVLAPGSRLGWIVGQKNLLERFIRQHEVSIQVSSGFAQSIINGILQRWGQDGYVDWLISLRTAYSTRRDVCVDALGKYMPKEYVEFIAPTAGMFFWVKVDASKSPKYKGTKEDLLQLEHSVYKTGLKHKVQIIPGHWFYVENKKEGNDNAMYFRGTFCSVGPKELDLAIKQFGVALREEFGSA